MHTNNFILESRIKILQVNRVTEENGTIQADITTLHFGRVTQKPYTFNLLDWAEIIERGYID